MGSTSRPSLTFGRDETIVKEQLSPMGISSPVLVLQPDVRLRYHINNTLGLAKPGDKWTMWVDSESWYFYLDSKNSIFQREPYFFPRQFPDNPVLALSNITYFDLADNKPEVGFRQKPNQNYYSNIGINPNIIEQVLDPLGNSVWSRQG